MCVHVKHEPFFITLTKLPKAAVLKILVVSRVLAKGIKINKYTCGFKMLVSEPAGGVEPPTLSLLMTCSDQLS